MLRIRKDKNKCVRYLFSALFALLAFCFTSFIINQENSVYAVSDYTETITSTSGNFFINCNLACIQQYHYLILEWTPVSSNNFIAFKAHFTRGSTGRDAPIYVSSWASPPFIIDISNIDSVFTWDGTPPSGLNLVATLTESYRPGSPSGSITLSENGTYDVSSYAEAVVDVPAEVVPGDYDDEFNGVIIAIYTCGAILIMIYFFYIIYGIIIKPTGGYK